MLTRKEALMLAQAEFWKDMTDEHRARFQLWARRCCMPLHVFQTALERTLGRDVYTHEMTDFEGLTAELDGERPAPTIDEILAMIPAGRRVIVSIERPSEIS